jgi:translation initiation factor IF-3
LQYFNLHKKAFFQEIPVDFSAKIWYILSKNSNFLFNNEGINISSERNNKKTRVNKQIRSRTIRLIGVQGEQVGIVDLENALRQSEEVGLDLVEISPNADPPVCRIMDYGKYLFELGKKQKKKPKHTMQVKEVKLRPVTEMGDYMVKIRKAIEFLKEGNKVKFTVRFRGREMSYQNLGTDILKRIENDLLEYGSIEQQAKLEGRQMVMIVGPVKK